MKRDKYLGKLWREFRGAVSDQYPNVVSDRSIDATETTWRYDSGRKWLSELTRKRWIMSRKLGNTTLSDALRNS